MPEVVLMKLIFCRIWDNLYHLMFTWEPSEFFLFTTISPHLLHLRSGTLAVRESLLIILDFRACTGITDEESNARREL